MQIQFLAAPEFSIDQHGVLRRSGSWLLSADEETIDISSAAETWAGKTGSSWRQPNSSGDGYTLDPSIVITEITAQALDSSAIKVTFKGIAASGSPVVIIDGSYKFERRKDLTEYKTARFTLADNDPENMPRPGDMVDWAGENYRCESAVAEEESDGSFGVTLTAVNIAIEPAGKLEYSSNTEFEKVITASYLVMPDALEEFLLNNSLHNPAPWAGENYYVFKIDTEPADSALRTRVTLQARYANLQLIEALRSEEIVSLGSEVPEILYIWSSRWRAGSGDQELFEAMLGTAPQGWGDPGSIICKVTPTRISDCEFEYRLEARCPESVGCSIKHKYWQDRDLPDRREYYARVGEMRFSPIQCGYSFRSNGNYAVVANWQPNQQCPLQTNNALPQRLINQPIKLLEIVEVTYLRGISSNNMSSIVSWFTGSRVSNSTLAGITGSFLRYDLDVDDVTDSRDRKWTRITKAYRLAPVNYSWNQNYWV